MKAMPSRAASTKGLGSPKIINNQWVIQIMYNIVNKARHLLINPPQSRLLISEEKTINSDIIEIDSWILNGIISKPVRGRME